MPAEYVKAQSLNLYKIPSLLIITHTADTNKTKHNYEQEQQKNHTKNTNKYKTATIKLKPI